jgi:predicted nucleotidyltransferase
MAAFPNLALNASGIAAFCRRHSVRELAIFGSAARGELRPDSDLDVLVDFLPDARVDLLELSAMARELTALCGRRVDLAVKPALKPSVRAEVLAEAQTLYAA